MTINIVQGKYGFKKCINCQKDGKDVLIAGDMFKHLEEVHGWKKENIKWEEPS